MFKLLDIEYEIVRVDLGVDFMVWIKVVGKCYVLVCEVNFLV